ncbi:PDDEXK nuclease domain-containing protein [Methanospirillum sp.]
MNEIHLSNAESCNYCRYFVRAQRAHKGLTKGSSNILPLPDRKLQPLAGEISWTKPHVILGKSLELTQQGFFSGLLSYQHRLKYFVALDTQIRDEGENPSNGMILSKEKSRTTPKCDLRDASRPIGNATYRIVSELPRELEGQIPGPDEISRLLEGI